MQERVSNDLPDMKIHLSVERRQRPQRQWVVQAAIERQLQHEHQHIGRDQALDGWGIVHEVF
jgi:hypothetical protein